MTLDGKPFLCFRAIVLVLVCACSKTNDRVVPAAQDAGVVDAAAACSPPSPSIVRIAVLGDRTGNKNDVVFVNVLKQIHRMAPDVLISVGDLIEGYQPDGKLTEAAAEWETVFGFIQREMGDIPLYSAAGNHDVWSEKSLRIFEERMQPRNAILEFGDVAVIIFDTSRVDLEKNIPDADLDWLVGALNRAREKKSRIVVTHKPLFAQPEGGRYGAPLHDVLIAGDANWVICGHWHHAMADDRDDIQYRMIGPSGARPNRAHHPESGNFTGFGWLVIDEAGVRYSLLNSDGVMAADAFSYEMNQLEWKTERRAVVPVDFEIDPVAPPTSGTIELTVTNVTEDTLDTTLYFESPEWRMAPSERKIVLGSKNETKFEIRFARNKGASLFPGPLMKMAVPFFGTEYLLRKYLTPTLWVRLRDPVGPPPVIDGELNESAWKRAVSIGDFTTVSKDPMLFENEIKAVIQDGVLYVSARMVEPNMAVDGFEQDDGEYLENADHLLIMVDGNLETPEYARFVINTEGRLSYRWVGAQRSTMDEKLPVSAAALRDEKGWTAEFALPLNAVEGTPLTHKIGFNIARGRVRQDTRSRAYWQPLLEHDEEALGRLSFSPERAKLH